MTELIGDGVELLEGGRRWLESQDMKILGVWKPSKRTCAVRLRYRTVKLTTIECTEYRAVTYLIRDECFRALPANFLGSNAET